MEKKARTKEDRAVARRIKNLPLFLNQQERLIAEGDSEPAAFEKPANTDEKTGVSNN